MSMAINSMISGYTYSYQSKLQPKLDKDNDGRWSRTEVQNYANSYQKATGTELDVDKIMSTYAGEDGYINAENQAKIRESDALGLSKLANTATQSTSETSSMAKDLNVSDLMGSMTPAGKASFTLSISRFENMSNLLQNFLSTNSSEGSYTFMGMTPQGVSNLYKSTMLFNNSGSSQTMANQLLSVLA